MRTQSEGCVDQTYMRIRLREITELTWLSEAAMLGVEAEMVGIILERSHNLTAFLDVAYRCVGLSKPIGADEKAAFRRSEVIKASVAKEEGATFRRLGVECETAGDTLRRLPGEFEVGKSQDGQLQKRSIERRILGTVAENAIVHSGVDATDRAMAMFLQALEGADF